MFFSDFIFEVSVQPRSAKPGNAQTNWTGTTSYQADYCHLSSGNGDLARGRALSDPQHMTESAAAGDVSSSSSSVSRLVLLRVQPANRDTFLIAVTELEGSLTLEMCRMLEQEASIRDVRRPVIIMD